MSIDKFQNSNMCHEVNSGQVDSFEQFLTQKMYWNMLKASVLTLCCDLFKSLLL